MGQVVSEPSLGLGLGSGSTEGPNCCHCGGPNGGLSRGQGLGWKVCVTLRRQKPDAIPPALHTSPLPGPWQMLSVLAWRARGKVPLTPLHVRTKPRGAWPVSHLPDPNPRGPPTGAGSHPGPPGRNAGTRGFVPAATERERTGRADADVCSPGRRVSLAHWSVLFYFTPCQVKETQDEPPASGWYDVPPVANEENSI